MDPLDLGKVFVKTVVRMFYETEHIVVVDALVYHGALNMSDLVLVLDMGKSSKTVGKFVGKLKEAGLISVTLRQELREGAQKPITREYYYIDYRRAIDAVKYKIHKVDSRIKKDAKPTTEKMEFGCKRCKHEYTQMQVLDHIDPNPNPDEFHSGFLCLNCNYPLIFLNDDDAPEPESDDTPAKFNRQFKPILDLMQQIDGVVIPHVDPKDAVDGAVPLPRNKETDPGAKHVTIEETVIRPTAVKGTNTKVEKIEVQIASSSEYNEQARAAEKARQEKIAAQNQLPAWHVKSTVDKSEDGSGAGATAAGLTNGVNTPTIKAETLDIKPDPVGNLDDVFAQLEAERAKAAAEEEDDEEDEDEDDFEDALVVDAAPESKRVKLESSAAPTPTNATTPAVSTGDGGDESDEDEFEDVS